MFRSVLMLQDKCVCEVMRCGLSWNMFSFLSVDYENKSRSHISHLLLTLRISQTESLKLVELLK